MSLLNSTRNDASDATSKSRDSRNIDAIKRNLQYLIVEEMGAAGTEDTTVSKMRIERRRT